jgi:hypothetical protein
MKTKNDKLEITLCGRTVADFTDEADLLKSAPARVAELDAMARRAATEAVRCALSAGAILLAVRDRLPHGTFLLWISTNCGSVSSRTAQRYMALAEAAANEAREGVADGAPRALIGDRSLTDLYRDYGIVRKEASASWGGAREGAGRKTKNPAAEVAAAAGDPDLNWAEVSGYLRGIREFAVEEDGFGTLADDDLESAVVILTEVAERARALLAARREGGQKETVARIREELAPDVPCVRADADGFCTGPCEGSICVRCAEYRPAGRVKA